MLVWIILYSANMKVSPSAQGEIPLAVVKSKSLWVQVPPVSSGSVAYSNGYNNTNQQMQNPVTPHREKSQPKMPTKRLRLLSRVSNNTQSVGVRATQATRHTLSRKTTKGPCPSETKHMYNRNLPHKLQYSLDNKTGKKPSENDLGI